MIEDRRIARKKEEAIREKRREDFLKQFNKKVIGWSSSSYVSVEEWMENKKLSDI